MKIKKVLIFFLFKLAIIEIINYRLKNFINFLHIFKFLFIQNIVKILIEIDYNLIFR